MRAPYRVAASLARAELRGRPARYRRLFVVIAAATAATFLVLALLGGVTGSLGREMEAVLTGDVRMSMGDNDLGEGTPMADSRDLVESFAWTFRDKGVRVSPRYELQALVEQGGDIERWQAVFLVGVDPALDAAAMGVDDRLVEGRFVMSPVVRDFVTYYPIVVSREFTRNLPVILWDGVGPITDAHVINATAGRELSSGSPIKARFVPVGVFETGFKMMDSRTIFTPIEAPRHLVGDDTRSASATAVVAKVDAPDRAAAWARERGLNATTGRAFVAQELAPVVNAVGLVLAVAGTIVFGATIAWTAHATGTIIHEDRRVIGALRAIGVPTRAIHLAYLGTGAGVGAAAGTGGLLAGFAGIVLVNLVPWHIPALETLQVTLAPSPWVALTLLFMATSVSVVAILVAFRPHGKAPVARALRD